MRHNDMYRQPGYLIRRLHQRSTAEFAAAANGLDVTQVQFSILLVLQDRPGTDATRISELIGSDRTTIRQALLVLEKKGFVRRATGVHDRRTKSLEITGEGARLTDQLSDLVPDLEHAILHGLTVDEHDTFLRLLTKLVGEEEGETVGGSSSVSR